MLAIKDLTFRIAGRTIFDNTTLTIPSGHKVGIIGENGTGKTTLFSLISGEYAPDNGSVTVQKGMKLGMVRQELPDDSMLLIDVVLDADEERKSLLHKAETVHDASELGDIYERLMQINAYEAPARAATILSGLGFDEEAQGRPLGDFSGGWRMRVALAAALFLEPDILLLDEPTNHLDLEAIIWLQNYLERFSGTLLLISHDRDMLNRVVSHIVHLDSKKLVQYTGTYDQFERTRAEKQGNQQALYEKQQAQRDKMMAFVNRFGAKASKARQAQSRLKAIEKMDLVDAVIAEQGIRFGFDGKAELASPLLRLEEVDAGYREENTADKVILSNLSLRIDAEDRIALLGANGNGKSTLMKLLSGSIDPLNGNFIHSEKLRIGYFAQHQTEALDPAQTPYQQLAEVMKGKNQTEVRGYLGRFGFDKQKADTVIDNLSGGEKARLLFAVINYRAPHILLLDEPTNHLDMGARQALIEALNGYSGAIIIVSHDPHIIESVADELWIVADGRCVPFDGDMDDYQKLITQQRRKEKQADINAKAKSRENKAERQEAAGKRQQLAPVRQAVTKIEKEIAKLNSEKTALEQKMLANSGAHDAALQISYGEVEKKIAALEEEWLALQAQLEG